MGLVSVTLVLSAIVVICSSRQSRPKPRQEELTVSDHRVRPASKLFAELISRGWPATNQEQKTQNEKVSDAYQSMTTVMDKLELKELPDWILQSQSPYLLKEEYFQLLEAKRIYDRERIMKMREAGSYDPRKSEKRNSLSNNLKISEDAILPIGDSYDGIYYARKHSPHTPEGQHHLHLYSKGNQIAELNIDGSTHDDWHGKRLPSKVQKGIKTHFPGFKVPKDGML
ncbi:MAG: hypothetical protein ACI9R3_000064 [Verrucomicrobiales bacterium]|jgi:hypothetical protein